MSTQDDFLRLLDLQVQSRRLDERIDTRFSTMFKPGRTPTTQIENSDTVSGTTVIHAGLGEIKIYWSEGRSSHLVVKWPSGKVDVLTHGPEYNDLLMGLNAFDEHGHTHYRAATAAEEAEHHQMRNR